MGYSTPKFGYKRKTQCMYVCKKSSIPDKHVHTVNQTCPLGTAVAFSFGGTASTCNQLTRPVEFPLPAVVSRILQKPTSGNITTQCEGIN